jgi:hypothetical protein
VKDEVHRNGQLIFPRAIIDCRRDLRSSQRCPSASREPTVAPDRKQNHARERRGFSMNHVQNGAGACSQGGTSGVFLSRCADSSALDAAWFSSFGMNTITIAFMTNFRAASGATVN